MKPCLVMVAAVVCLLVSTPALPADLPVAEMQQAIDKGVDFLIAQQRADGAYPYNISWVKGGYDVGMTSLVTLALRHARSPKASTTISKSMGYLTQHSPEASTYSAGLIEMVLFEDNPTTHARLISAYAWMVCMSQVRSGAEEGAWGYDLVPAQGTIGAQGHATVPNAPGGRMDHSNSQYGVLALTYAERAGYQVPEKVWQRVKAHYEATQQKDGGWSYVMNSEGSGTSMTAASTVSLYLADEALTSKDHKQCKMAPENPAVERGMDWLGKRNIGGQAYGWYAVERLGILTGRSEFGGKDWMEDGAKALLKYDWAGERGGPVAGNAFAVLFLARALEPIIFNKLKRKGDWNNDPYDIKHLSDHLGAKYQHANQWRIVTLEASVDYLLRVPILFISGHQALDFTDEEKSKLKEYVNRGGTIFAMACCGSKPFDDSLRKLCAELWPDAKLLPLPKTHQIYTSPKPLASAPQLEGLGLNAGQGRLGVIYSPYDLCCRWSMGGSKAGSTLDVGASVYFYVATTGVRLGGVKEGFRVDTSPAAKPADAPKPEPDAQPDVPKVEPPAAPDAPKVEPPAAPDAPKVEPPVAPPAPPDAPKPDAPAAPAAKAD